MLPVQTVMIRYMVLVYRWGDRWLSAAGDWGGFAGGAVTRGWRRSLMVLAEAHSLRRARLREGPAGEGPAGPFRGEYYSVLSSSGLGAGKGLGSKSSQPSGMVNVQLLDKVRSSRANDLPSGFVSIS